MIGFTVVGKPAATVITSSPGRSLRSPSFGEVRQETATRFADEPEFTSETERSTKKTREVAFELPRETARSKPSVERRIDDRLQVIFPDNLARHRNRRNSRLEFIGRKSLFEVFSSQFQELLPKLLGFLTHSKPPVN